MRDQDSALDGDEGAWDGRIFFNEEENGIKGSGPRSGSGFIGGSVTTL